MLVQVGIFVTLLTTSAMATIRCYDCVAVDGDIVPDAFKKFLDPKCFTPKELDNKNMKNCNYGCVLSKGSVFVGKNSAEAVTRGCAEKDDKLGTCMELEKKLFNVLDFKTTYCASAGELSNSAASWSISLVTFGFVSIWLSL
ncbi:unnamed protein product [Bursaphelenchus okinawaensis]|uniref:Uncharacterized protein n=1 Tax=Bursaphelenchus okinawaensis TaxID=465554 RepID=A0A811KA14_9BILA|nr:unnamed protein product [Bursaphelenchus okinawaensis]CAG9098242.1 unnamed protein product [Bursaphelenchus okinawaensis]